MNNDQNLRFLWAISLVGLLVLAEHPSSAARSAGEEPIVAVVAHGGLVTFAPRVSSEGMTLTVAGRGYVVEQYLASGQSASFAPVDEKGYSLPDGTYTWEIVLSSRPQALKPSALRNGEVLPNGRTVEAAEAPRGGRQSGAFTIKNGMIVDPNLVEAVSSRPASSPTQGGTEAPSPAARNAEQIDRDGS